MLLLKRRRSAYNLSPIPPDPEPRQRATNARTSSGDTRHTGESLGVLTEAVKECAKEGAKEIGKEYGKELAVHAAGKAVSPLATELAQAVGGELTKAVTEPLSDL